MNWLAGIVIYGALISCVIVFLRGVGKRNDAWDKSSDEMHRKMEEKKEED